MTIIVNPDGREVTHHIRLYDSEGNEVGLIGAVPAGKGQYMPDIRGVAMDPVRQTAIKTTSSPGTRHSDFEPPYSFDEQTTWAQGRGVLFQPDTPVGFYDSRNAWTMKGDQLLPSGLMHYGRGYRDQDFYMPQDAPGVSWYQLTDNEGIAVQFTAGASYTAENLSIICRQIGSPANGLKIALHNDSSDTIGSELASDTLAVDTYDKLLSFMHTITTPSDALSDGTKYWVAITSAGGTGDDHWLVAYDDDHSGTRGAVHNGTSWSVDANQTDIPFYRVRDADVKRRWHFFGYKQGLYVATEPEDASATPQIFRNGWRGVADSNSGEKDKLKDSTQTGWTTAMVEGSVVMLTEGPGSFDYPRHRDVTAGASGELTVSPDWITTHDASETEYVVRGSDWWEEITGHGMTSPIRDVAAPQEVIYFALGNDTNIRRGGEYNNSGTWAQRTWTDDGSNKADILTSALDQIDGMQVVRGLNSDAAGHVSVSRASAKAWGEKLQFASSIPIGDDHAHINSIIKGESEIFIIKEDAVYAVRQDSPEEIANFLSFRSAENGLAAIYVSPYLYFSLGRGGFERLLERNMEDIGLWRGEGLSTDRQGPISAAVGTPQYVFVAVDAGGDGYSTVYAYNGSWHEIFRAPETGQRIRSLTYDVVPGSAANRLWIGMDADLVWIPMPNNLNPFYDDEFDFTYETVVVSSWIDEGTRDLQKYAKDMELWCENLSAGNQYVEWDYQTNQDADSDDWTQGSSTFDTTPSEEIAVGKVFKRFRYRLRIYTEEKDTGPRITANTISLITNIPPKFAGEVTYMIDEEDGEVKDLRGEPDGQTFSGIMSQLKSWASSPQPINMECVDADLHNLEVIVHPTPRRATYLIEGESSGHVGSIKLQEA